MWTPRHNPLSLRSRAKPANWQKSPADGHVHVGLAFNIYADDNSETGFTLSWSRFLKETCASLAFLLVISVSARFQEFLTKY